MKCLITSISYRQINDDFIHSKTKVITNEVHIHQKILTIFFRENLSKIKPKQQQNVKKGKKISLKVQK